MYVSFAGGPRVPVGRQVEHPEPVEHQTDHYPSERVVYPLFRLVPPTAHLDRRLSVEHAQLVPYNETHDRILSRFRLSLDPVGKRNKECLSQVEKDLFFFDVV